MYKRICRLTGAIALAAATTAICVPAHAQSINVGILNCHESSGWGLVFGSSKDLRCVYQHGSVTEHYEGTITKFGVDIGYSAGAVIVWNVWAPVTGLTAGALGGTFVGGQASAAVGGGVGANALVGGSNRSITLQPLSVEGKTGLNVAAGIAAMSLRYVGTGAVGQKESAASPPG